MAAQLYREIETRKQASVMLEHAIARLGYYGADGWPPSTLDDNDREACHLMQNCKWSIEAMDSPASNRFWDEQRREYNEMLAAM